VMEGGREAFRKRAAFYASRDAVAHGSN
jgi:hypothetical protein